jgi:voltage-gated potassium channel Kch
VGYRGAIAKLNVVTSDTTPTLDIKVWASTVVSNTSGAWSVDITKTGFTKILSVTATAQLDTTNATLVPMAGIRSYTTDRVVGWVVQSNSFTYMLGGSAAGLKFSSTPTVIHVQVIGI